MLSISLLLSLVAVAAGSPVPSIHDYVNALESRQSISSSTLDELKFYAQYAAAAYCNSVVSPGTLITCGGECPDVEADGAVAVDAFQGLVTGIGAYVAVDDARQLIVLGVRGSNNVRDFITDVVFPKQDCPFSAGCAIHDGFATAWDEISSASTSAISSALDANPGYSVVITGHSLGASVATIAAAYLRSSGFGTIDLYTYGSPRTGNAAFVDFVDQQEGAEYRVTHLDDPVPRLPPMFFNYAHTSPEYWLDDGTATTDDYGVGDIKICTGTATTGCNAGTAVGLDIDAHLNYFEPISGCSGGSLQFKRQTDVSDEELSDRLAAWAKQDQDYAATV